jgi:hypothetical protein
MRMKKPDHGPVCDDGIALDEPAAAAVAATPPRFDAWRARRDVRHLSRQLRKPNPTSTASPERFPAGPRRFDPPQNLLDTLQNVGSGFAPITSAPTSRSLSRSHRTDGLQYVSWLIVLAGTIVLAGGIGLIAWTLSAREMLYWNLAIGLTLGGQGALIFGLVMVNSRLWRNGRHAVHRLHDIQAQLGQLQHTAESLTAMRSGGAPTFYADLVRGASPHVLLANLKGQLDQLATRIGTGR